MPCLRGVGEYAACIVATERRTTSFLVNAILTYWIFLGPMNKVRALLIIQHKLRVQFWVGSCATILVQFSDKVLVCELNVLLCCTNTLFKMLLAV